MTFTNQTSPFSVWLLNPVTAIVSARGNAESLLSTVILGVIYCLTLKHVAAAALLFGFAVHFKVYPIVYALPLYLVLDGDYDGYVAVVFVQSNVARAGV
jgi:phosphatidylinositol glycan class M